MWPSVVRGRPPPSETEASTHAEIREPYGIAQSRFDKVTVDLAKHEMVSN
jgi:hypothetical protein